MAVFSNRAQLLFSRRAQLMELFADILDYPAPGLAEKAAECAVLIGAAQPEAVALLESFDRFAPAGFRRCTPALTLSFGAACAIQRGGHRAPGG